MKNSNTHKKFQLIISIIFLLLLLFSVGCQEEQQKPEPIKAAAQMPQDNNKKIEDANIEDANKVEKICICPGFAPVKATFAPLTGITVDSDNEIATISAFVALSDKFNSNVKSPVVFRFELFRQIPRSGQPKGQRLFKWDDIDLNDAEKNNLYWRDFLRAYQFDLTFEAAVIPNCILQVTCICPNNKRITADFVIKPGS